MEMLVRYKIQAAYTNRDAQAIEGEQVSGFHFWRLVKESADTDGSKTVEVEATLNKASIEALASDFSKPPTSVHTKNFVQLKPLYTHIVYGDRIAEIDAKERWNQAVKQISQFCLLVTLQKNPTLFYHYFASLLDVVAYCLAEKNFSAKHTLQNMFLPKMQYPIAGGIRYKIKAAMHCVVLKYKDYTILKPLPIDNLRVAHHFWMLVAQEHGQEHILETMHGLATRYGNPEKLERVVNPLQSWGAFLKVYCITPTFPGMANKKISYQSEAVDHTNDWILPEHSKVVYGHLPEHNALMLWHRAHILMQTLNKKGPFPYSFLGLGKTLGIQATNSNSIYATLALGLNLPTYRFKGYLALGINRPVLSQSDIKIQRNALTSS